MHIIFQKVANNVTDSGAEVLRKFPENIKKKSRFNLRSFTKFVYKLCNIFFLREILKMQIGEELQVCLTSSSRFAASLKETLDAFWKTTIRRGNE